ncbi:MAG: hypothetical protein R3E79_26580 [Caldilineaceae bacterium]
MQEIEGILAGIPHITLERLPKLRPTTYPCFRFGRRRRWGLTRDAIADALLAGDPHCVVVLHHTSDSIVIQPPHVASRARSRS